MTLECNFFKHIKSINDELNTYKQNTHEQLMTSFIKDRLQQTLEAYQKELAISEDYLSNVPAQQVFREVNFQQKKRFKEMQEHFDPKNYKKKNLKEATEGD